MIVKDSMVLIHLAKITLLEKSCEYFKKVVIPEAVYNEVLSGKGKRYPDVNIVADLVEKRKITVKQIKNNALIKRAEEFNIQRGEAEAVVLYWQEKADYLATDDDNVRKKGILLNITLIGTPVIILKLYKENLIGKEKFSEALAELKKIAWFSNSVIDKMIMEGLKWGRQ